MYLESSNFRTAKFSLNNIESVRVGAEHIKKTDILLASAAFNHVNNNNNNNNNNWRRRLTASPVQTKIQLK